MFDCFREICFIYYNDFGCFWIGKWLMFFVFFMLFCLWLVNLVVFWKGNVKFFEICKIFFYGDLEDR